MKAKYRKYTKRYIRYMRVRQSIMYPSAPIRKSIPMGHWHKGFDPYLLGIIYPDFSHRRRRFKYKTLYLKSVGTPYQCAG